VQLSCLYTGTSEPSWISRTTAPLFIPYHRLMRRWGGKLPRSPWKGHWALDSGGFDHVRKHGGWALAPQTYVDHVRVFDREIGNMGWAAPMDMMCEADALAATGLTELAHQEFTVANFVELEEIWYRETDAESPFTPVLQANPDLPEVEMIASYLRCWDMYGEAGVDLGERSLVGLGSICRQQATPKIGALVAALHERDGRDADVEPLPLHAFGCKALGLTLYGDLIGSADSQAWSYFAYRNYYKWPGCPMSHSDCRNCFYWAMAWRYRLLDKVGVFDHWFSSRSFEPEWLNAFFLDGDMDAARVLEPVAMEWR
jgi:hypothetical protein